MAEEREAASPRGFRERHADVRSRQRARRSISRRARAAHGAAHARARRSAARAPLFLLRRHKALGPDDIVRGYENDDGSFTIVADEELDALAPRKSRDIDLRRFVKREEIPRQPRAAVRRRPRATRRRRTTCSRRRWSARAKPALRLRHARQGVSRRDLRRGRLVARRDDALRRSCAPPTTSACPASCGRPPSGARRWSARSPSSPRTSST